MDSGTAPAQKSNRNIIIAVVAGVVVLCCCCLPIVVYGLNWLWTNGDQLLGDFSRALPFIFGA